MAGHSPTCDGNGNWYWRGDAVLIHGCLIREARDRAIPDFELRAAEEACARRVHLMFHEAPYVPGCRWCAEVRA